MTDLKDAFPSVDRTTEVMDTYAKMITDLYREMLSLNSAMDVCSPEMKEAYAKVIFDMNWRATRLIHTFRDEWFARLSEIEAKSTAKAGHISTE